MPMSLLFGTQEAHAQKVADTAVFAMRDKLIAEYGSRADFLWAVQWAQDCVESEVSLLNSLKDEEGDGVTQEELDLQEREVLDVKDQLAAILEKKKAARW